MIYSIAPSPLDANLVWAGTDDGLIHVTRDDGKTWQNVTPPSLTPWSKVGIIDAGHFDAGTAYAAIDRHRLEDYTPHILRTHDGGRTWQAIITGLPDGDYINVVREDPRRQGLLYAGSELGIWISFDDGDHWQPLQLNLPHVSVRDIDVHGDDLVIATHGRAFWILDDITPLRQVSAQTAQQPALLFKPQAALRIRPGSDEGTPLPPEIPKAPNPPAGAAINYWLAQDSASPVTLEVVDDAGKVARRYSSADPVAQVDPRTLDIPMYWVHPAQPPAATRGMHRFMWDMRYAPPEGAGGGGRQGGGGRFGGGGVWAPPGDYTVRLTAGGQTYTQTLTLKADPRVKSSAADLNLQFDVATQLQDLAGRANRAARQADALKRAAQQAQPKLTDAAAKQALDAFVKQIDEIAGPPAANPFSGEPETGEPERTTIRTLARMFAQLQGAAQSADVAPTADVTEGMRAGAKDLDDLSARWSALLSTDLPKLNDQLKAAGAEPIALPAGGGRQ